MEPMDISGNGTIDHTQAPAIVPQLVQQPAPDPEDLELMQALQHAINEETSSGDQNGIVGESTGTSQTFLKHQPSSQINSDSEDDLFVSQPKRARRSSSAISLTEEPNNVSASTLEQVQGTIDLAPCPEVNQKDTEDTMNNLDIRSGSTPSSSSSSPDSESEFEPGEDGSQSDEEQPAQQNRKRSRNKGKQTKVPPKGSCQDQKPSKGAVQFQSDEQLESIYNRMEQLEALKKKGKAFSRTEYFKLKAKINQIEEETESTGEAETMEQERTKAATAAKLTKADRAPRGRMPRNIREYYNKKYSDPNSKERRSVGLARTHVEQLFTNQSAGTIASRAAQGAVTVLGPIVAPSKKHEAILAMKGPDAKRGDQTLLNNSISSFGCRKLTPNGRDWLLKGMKTPLHNHQVVGTSWMADMELSPWEPFGGLNCDAMGLGKTMQTIALICANKPTEEDRKAGRSRTLIVAPAAVCPQWISEFRKHLDFKKLNLDAGSIFQYRSSLTKLMGPVWTKADIIVTSYNEMTRQYASKQRMEEIDKMIKERHLDTDDKERLIQEEYGELLAMEWYRVVLDEGHYIRNSNTTTSLACRALRKKHSWVLTGTPLHNSSKDFFAYMDFIGHPQAEQFSSVPTGNSSEDIEKGYQQMIQILGGVMLRRLTSDKFLGHSILNIPQTHSVKTYYARLSVEENLIYRRIQDVFIKKLEQLMALGHAGKRARQNLAFAWINLSRRLIGHPFAAEGVMGEFMEETDFEDLIEQLHEKGGNTPVSQQLKEWVEMESDMKTTNGDQAASSGTAGYGETSSDIIPYLHAMKNGEDIVDLDCGWCSTTLQNRVTLPCHHSFCRGCLDDAERQHGRLCPTCGAPLPDDEKDQDEDDEETYEPITQKKGRGTTLGKRKKTAPGKKKREYGQDIRYFQPKMRDPSLMVESHDRDYAINPSAQLVPGAKTVIARKLILEWQAEAPDDKIIVFFIFLKTACILGRILSQEGIDFVYFCGDLNPKGKSDALLKFREDPKCKVMLSSLSCGGVGLNLTCANRVIIVDQWWNSALEEQAFGRVHRDGQKKETWFVKIHALDTVDDCLRELQKKKEKDISRTLSRYTLTDQQIESLIMTGYKPTPL